MRTLLIFGLLLAFSSAFSQQGTVDLTISVAPAPTAGQVIPKLTWNTTPAASGCTASGDPAWSGTKAASGTQTLAAVSPISGTMYALRCAYPGATTAALTWIAPSERTDGTALPKCASASDTGTCLAKYRILFGTAANALTQSREHAFPNATTATITGLTAATWFFALKAVQGNGVESASSNVASKTIAADFEATASVGIQIPKMPTNLTAN